MAETLTRQQIEKRFESEWVLVDNPETDDQMEVVRGTVIFHSTDQDKVYQKANELKPKYFAVLYTGKMPEHVVLAI